MQATEVLNFGIFERDKPPEAKLIATTIDEYDNKIDEKTGYIPVRDKQLNFIYYKKFSRFQI